MRLDSPVLVLNASYEPIHIASLKRALKLIVKGVAGVENALNHEIRRGIKVPTVVRLYDFRKVPHIRVQPQHRHIYLRDGYTCQYCGEKFPSSELTLDHIIPRARGGKSTWENLVAACQPCNNEKGDKTPEEWGRPLLRKPRPVTIHTSRQMLRIMGRENEHWKEYLYY